MLQKVYEQFIMDNLSNYSPLDIKLNNFSKHLVEFSRMFREYNKYKSSEIFADYMYETGRSVEEYILSNESIEHVQNAKTNINLKRTTNPKKIIQYALVYFCVTTYNLDRYDLQNCIDKYLTIEERLNLLYSVIKYCSDNGKELSTYNIDMLSTSNITHDREHIELISTEATKEVLNNLIVSLSNTADDTMKNALENLMNDAGITDYTIQPYNIVEHIPNYSSRWYGGDSGGISRSCDGTIKETSHDFGYIAIVKKPSAQISTDGKNFYVVFKDISKPIVYSEYDINNYVSTGRSAVTPDIVDRDILVKLLKLNKDIKSKTITASVHIKKFKDYYHTHPYNVPFYENISLNQQINGSKCNPLCANIKTIPSSNGILQIKFTFMSNVSLNSVKEYCDIFIDSFIESNIEHIRTYSENYYLDDLYNKPKYSID